MCTVRVLCFCTSFRGTHSSGNLLTKEDRMDKTPGHLCLKINTPLWQNQLHSSAEGNTEKV